MSKAFKIFAFAMLLVQCSFLAVVAHVMFFPDRGDKPDFLRKLQSGTGALVTYELGADECISPDDSNIEGGTKFVTARKMDDSNGFFYLKKYGRETRAYGIFTDEISWNFEVEPQSPSPRTYCGNRLSFERDGRLLRLVSVSSKP